MWTFSKGTVRFSQKTAPNRSQLFITFSLVFFRKCGIVNTNRSGKGVSFMMTQVTLSANAGIALQLDSLRLWADALHRRKVPGFSAVTPALWEAITTHPDLAAPDILLYTQCHPDHFSRTLTRLALERWPKAKPILPETFFPEQLLLSGRRERLKLPDYTLDFLHLPHEGPQYAHVAHYGLLLEHQGFRVLIPGDCALCAPELAAFLAESGPVDLALLDFPWITLKRGREFVQKHIRPKTLLVYHLPFAGDDLYNYRKAAAKAAAQLDGMDVRLLMDPFQREQVCNTP